MTTTAEVIGPTSSRIAHNRGNDLVAPTLSQSEDRKAYRIVTAVETMRRQGRITEGMWAAYDRFEEEWALAGAGPSIIARYGERAGSGGTPVAHMTSAAFDAIERRDSRRRLALGKVEQALLAVHLPRLVKALVLSVANECGLEAIGRSISRHKDRAQAIAVAGAALEDALWCLEQHYARLYGQSQLAP